MEVLSAFWGEFLRLTQEMAPYLFLGFGVAGLLHVFVPDSWVYRQLGRRSAWSVFKGAVLGAPLPLCSCGVLPVAASLKRSGASPPAVLSFLVATPVTGIDSILATYALLGGFLAVVRPAASVFIALLAGLVLLVLPADGGGKDGVVEAGTGAVRGSLLRRLAVAADYAFNELMGGISRAVLVGLALGAAISLFVPADLVTRFSGASVWTYLGMVAVGTPLYICATGSIPIAAALLAKGLTPGAALAFLLAGPATNAVAIAVAQDLLGRRGLLVYLGTIVFGSVAVGYGTDLLAGWLGILSAGEAAHHHHVAELGWFFQLSGWLLLAMLLFLALRPYVGRLRSALRPRSPGAVVLEVPEASCQNCARKISGTLQRLSPVAHVEVDLERRQVRIDLKSSVALSELQEELSRAGYESRPVSSPGEETE